TERAVYVVQLRKGGSSVEGGGHLRRERSGSVDQAAYLLAPLFQPAQVFETFSHPAQRLVIQAAVRLLAVTCDKGNGVPLVDQLNDLFRLPELKGKLIGKLLCEIHKSS